VQRAFAGLDPAALWDVHTHLLGTGDSGSGCRVDPRMTQWWHPVEALRKTAILQGACVPPGAPSVDRAYVARLARLADDFPPGARWLLYAFDSAHDDAGAERERWTTFHVPNTYAAQVAGARPERFGWVASVHPYREDALARLDQAIACGAVALKWLPSAMNIDLMAPRLAPFYARLAQSRLPLIVHCGEEKAVPGAGRDELGNPLRVRAPLQAGVRVIVAHCASLGEALDLDQRHPEPRPAFELFARLMDEPAWRGLLLGDVSALFQVNRSPEVWRTVLARGDWHERLLHGSDHPLPGVGPLYRLGPLVATGLLRPEDRPVLEALRQHNPLLFDLVLKRSLRWQGQGLADPVFDTRRHFTAPKVLT
jgi:mannonate dehydratase